MGAGVRREELVNLRFEDLKELPMKNGKTRTVVSLVGKGAKSRIADKLAKLRRGEHLRLII